MTKPNSQPGQPRQSTSTLPSNNYGWAFHRTVSRQWGWARGLCKKPRHKFGCFGSSRPKGNLENLKPEFIKRHDGYTERKPEGIELCFANYSRAFTKGFSPSWAGFKQLRAFLFGEISGGLAIFDSLDAMLPKHLWHQARENQTVFHFFQLNAVKWLHLPMYSSACTCLWWVKQVKWVSNFVFDRVRARESWKWKVSCTDIIDSICRQI